MRLDVPHPPARSTRPRRPAFTLVELMVSIAMVLLLMVGVWAVFDAASKTAGTGMRLEERIRELRAIERVFTRDFDRAVSWDQMPCLVLYSERLFMFRDQQDMDANQGNLDPGMADRDGDGQLDRLLTFEAHPRNHRLDRLMFFVRDVDSPFKSQTSNIRSGQIVSDETSSEAWVWYGHLNMPDPAAPNGPDNVNPASYLPPGAGRLDQNPENFFASDWAFGRMAILLKTQPDHDHVATPRAPVPKGYDPMAPLGRGSRVFPSNGAWLIEHSRCDVALTSIARFRKDHLLAYAQNVADAFDYRFNCKPWMVRGGDIGTNAALMAPILQRGVSQFIVEFAGDFVTQVDDPADPNFGQPIAGVPDSVYYGDSKRAQVDFVPVAGPNNLLFKQVRWYGMPRKLDLQTSTDKRIAGRGAAQVTPPAVYRSRDVVPLFDMHPAASAGVEHFYFRGNGRPVWPQTNYIDVPDRNNQMVYCCTWTSAVLDDPAKGRPSMFRIILGQTDATGRLPEGQTVEFVYSIGK